MRLGPIGLQFEAAENIAERPLQFDSLHLSCRQQQAPFGGVVAAHDPFKNVDGLLFLLLLQQGHPEKVRRRKVVWAAVGDRVEHLDRLFALAASQVTIGQQFGDPGALI